MTDRSSLHPSYFPHLHISNARDKWLLNGLRLSRELASRLVLFFLPVFLYQQGAEGDFLGGQLTDLQRGLLWVGVFFLIRNLVSVVSSIWLVEWVRGFGLQRSLVLGQLSFIGYFWLLVYGVNLPWLVLAAAVIDGIQVIFWSSYFTSLSQSADHNHLVSDIGLINFLLTLVAVTVPIVGGALAVWQGFSALFLVGIVVVLLGVVCALLMRVEQTQDRVSWKEFWRWLQELGYQKLALSYLGRYWNDVALMLWPLYVLFVVGAVDRVGYLYSLSLFLSVVVAYVAAQVVVRVKHRRHYMISGGVLSLLWFFRTGVAPVWSIVMIDVFERLTAGFHWLFFDTQFLSRGKGSQALSFFTYREVIIAFSGVMFWSVFIVGFVMQLWPLQWIFGLAGVGVWLTLLVQKHKHT